ncbi:hypothetical protein [Candidatus Nitrosotenuis uzonensis]|uniref:Uncharacterized protein n=1 Tax=Candidatus Nitrosotenuis uzonensis TaxID=1407055 RepID=V6AQU2_9ARCH|nr:hypothetical protein [Candidatus Nitrosotenuis uzonensis]CDI04920.1 hypothetical protein NITUZ_120024 [Candidatus Nitrosotenuis uzonensis]
MHATGPSEPKKGSGYFAKRLKEKGLTDDAPKTGNKADEPDVQSTVKAGQIFEESTKSIATMADDVSETAKLVSSMKEGLERVTKIADLFTNNPLCDSSGTCSYNGIGFSSKPDSEKDSAQQAISNYDDALSSVPTVKSAEIANLKTDANTIRDELQEFRDVINRKEAELLEFREKLNQARSQAHRFSIDESTRNELANYTVQELQENTDKVSEFDALTSNMDDFNSIQDTTNLATKQEEIKESEKKLLELRWNIKKSESEYEKRKALLSELDDVSSQVEKMESTRNALRDEIKKLEEMHNEPKLILRELEKKIEIAEREYSEKQAAVQKIEDVRSVLEYLKLDRDGLKSELEQIRTKIKESEKELREKNAANEALEDVRFTVSALRAEKETLDAEIEMIRAKLRKTEQELEEKRLEKERLGEVKTILAHMKLEKESLDAEIEELKIKVSKAEAEYRQKKAAADELHEVREVLAYLKPEREYLRSEISGLRSKIELLNHSYDEIYSKKHQMQLEFEDLRMKLKRLESEYEERKFSRFS